MKKRIALLALALTLCSAFAVFPVSAHAEETGTQTVSANSVDKRDNPACVRQDVIRLDQYEIRGSIRLYDHLENVKGRVEFSTDSDFAQVYGSTLKIDRSILDYESYADGSNEIIVKCMVPANKYYDEKELTLRFVVVKCDPKDNYADDMIDDECCLMDSEEKITIQKPDISALSLSEGKGIRIIAANGISVDPVLAAPRTVSFSADKVLSDRYGNTNEYSIMRIEKPFLNTKAGKIGISCENTSVIDLLGDNFCDRITGRTVRRTYVYPINEKGYEALAKGS